MRRFRVRATYLLLLVLGSVSVALWLWSAGAAAFTQADHIRPLQVVLLCAVTATCILLRFLRWQFLLRRMEVRVPIRRSLSIYLASLAGIATPAYIGEVSRAVLVAREIGMRVRDPIVVVALERILDLAAVGLLGVIATRHGWPFALTAVALIGALILFGRTVRLARLHDIAPALLDSVAQPRVLFFCLAVSLASWTAAATAISIAAASIGVHVTLFDGVAVFAGATLAGGLSLVPAGVAVTGGLAILQLQSLGVPLPDAVLIASVFRFGTVGITLAVACVFGLREWRVLRTRRHAQAALHFDDIAGEYLNQFSPHIWDLLIDRKLGFITEELPTPAAAAGLGLDLGCGLGQQCEWLSKRGYRVVGLDTSYGLLRFARSNDVDVVNGSATALPFADESLDFIYTIGVLHHLPTREHQFAAYADVARVLKPGGYFIVHETNPRNPLFRFYMGYVFPMLKRIDEGTERWLLPRRWSELHRLRVVRIRYFTFLPDFVPRALLPVFLKLERWLERSPLGKYSVHYMAVMQKPPRPAPQARPVTVPDAAAIAAAR